MRKGGVRARCRIGVVSAEVVVVRYLVWHEGNVKGEEPGHDVPRPIVAVEPSLSNGYTEKGMEWDGMRWDGMGWDGMGMGWDEMGWDGMRWDEMG